MMQTKPPVPKALPAIDSATTALVESASGQATLSVTYVCANREQFRNGGQMLRDIADLSARLEDKRTSVTGPLNEALRTINDWFRAPADALKHAKQVIGTRMAKFESDEKARERRENEEAERKARENREELQRRADAALAKGNEAKAQELVARIETTVAKPADIVAPKAKGVSLGEHWEFEVIDKAALPEVHKIANQSSIGQVVRALKSKEEAEKQIPGIRVWSRPKIGVRS